MEWGAKTQASDESYRGTAGGFRLVYVCTSRDNELAELHLDI